MPRQKIKENTLTSEEREELIVKNLPLVWKFVSKLCMDENMKEDCFQEGCKGLMRAARLYDSSRPSSFANFAAFEIQCYIKDYIFHNRLVPYPDAQRAAINRYRQQLDEYTKAGIDITDDLIYRTSKEYGLTDDVLFFVNNPIVSLDAPIKTSSEEEAHMLDLVPSANTPELIQELSFEELVKVIESVVYQLCDDDEIPKFAGEAIRTFLPHYIRTATGIREYDKQEGKTVKPLSFLDVIREMYPDYKISATDSDEERASKARKLDNLYCIANSVWNKQKQELRDFLVFRGYKTI